MDITEDQSVENFQTVGLADDAKETVVEALHPLVQEVQARFEQAKRGRKSHEERWSRAYSNYRAEYGKEVAFTESEKSKVFIKATKTKTLAAYGQVLEVLFADGKIPITIEPTPVPEGIADTVHIDVEDAQESGEQPSQEPEVIFGYAGDGQDSSQISLSDRIGSYLSRQFRGAKVKEGPGVAPSHLTLEPAKVAAKKMERKVHDQFVECDLASVVRKSAWEQVCLGTGVVKGPFAFENEYPRWDEQGNYIPVKRTVPKADHVSVWNFYPDPEAYTLSDCDFTVERHKMTKTMLRNLRRRPFFRKSAIEEAIMDGPNYLSEWWEPEIDENSETGATSESRWEVLEYWGVLDREFVEEELSQDLPEDLYDADEVQVNVWTCGHHLLRVVLNPFKPRRLPYQVFSYEMNPYSIFGVGVPENMEDCQTLMNGFTRLAIDNAVLAGNMMLEVDETNLAPGQSMKIEPGKIWRRVAGAPGQAVFGTKFPNTANENMMMFDKFRQIADDATGLPSYSHGQTGVTGTTRTASGMSMLMGAASLSIKTVVKNIDDYLLKPLGEAFYRFNMQFDFDPEIRGDLSVYARGTSSLMQREVKSQRIMQFIQIASSPVTAAYPNFEYLMKEAAKTLDLDPEKAVNDPKAAQVQAALMGQMGAVKGAPPSVQGPSMNDPTGTGGGMIGGAGQAFPGDPQFTGNDQGGGQQPQSPQMGGMNVQ